MRSRKRTKARQQRADAKRAKAFRDAIWARDAGFCVYCGQALFRSTPFGITAGHVHHLRGRNVAPEDRYNPDRAVLLCSSCHRAVHDGRLTLTGIGVGQ